MQRDGYDAIGLRDQVAPRTRHHACHRPGEIVPVLVFQAMDEASRHVAVERYGPRPREDGGLCEGLGRGQPADSEIDGEGDAEAVAERLLDEPQTGPAGGAERTRVGGGSAASGAGRGIDEAQREIPRPAEGGGGAPEGAAGLVGKGAQRAPAGCIAC